MTYCIAWKSKDSVFVVADSARTVESVHNIVLEKQQSAFGETSINEEGKVIEEYIHKLFQIERKVIVGFAGNVDIALETIDTFQKYFDHNNVVLSFERSINSVRTENGWDVQFLLGFVDKGEPKLYSFNVDNNGILQEEFGLVQIGSMASSSPYSYLAVKFYNEHLAKLRSSEQQFYQALSFFQHLGLHDHTFKYNAGGIYSGALVNIKGAKWMEDTAYIIFDKNLSDKTQIKLLGRVQIYIRYHSLIHYSTLTNTKEIFIHNESNPIYLNESVHEDIISLEKQSISRVFSFLCINDRTIAIIKTNENNCNQYFCEAIGKDGPNMGFNCNPSVNHPLFEA